jgi:hypothetical protein
MKNWFKAAAVRACLHMQWWPEVIAAGLLAAILAITSAWPAATLMPNGKQQFINGAGSPLAGGQVFMYQPGTALCKNTWQDPAQTILNTCPIVLDGNGSALIYGTGTYRQVVQDVNSALLWDQLTTDASSFNNSFWAGNAGGTPNAITITDPGFNGVDGSVIQFIAINTNTGATTLNPSGFGAISVVQNTPSGPAALSGAQIVAGNVVTAVYSASLTEFFLQNPTSSTLISSPPASFTNLNVIASSITNNMAVTADSVSARALDGSSRTLVNVNCSANPSTVGPGGLDAGSPTSGVWYAEWVIFNQTTNSTACLLSASFTLAGLTLPTGYNYAVRVSANELDALGAFFNMFQRGRQARYTPVPGTNTAGNGRQIAFGVAGTYSATTPTYATLLVVNTFVPPSAGSIIVLASNNSNGGTLSNVLVAQNINFNGVAGAFQPAPVFLNNANAALALANIPIDIGSNNIFWASSAAGGSIWTEGWDDNL